MKNGEKVKVGLVEWVVYGSFLLRGVLMVKLARWADKKAGRLVEIVEASKLEGAAS